MAVSSGGLLDQILFHALPRSSFRAVGPWGPRDRELCTVHVVSHVKRNQAPLSVQLRDRSLARPCPTNQHLLVVVAVGGVGRRRAPGTTERTLRAAAVAPPLSCAAAAIAGTLRRSLSLSEQSLQSSVSSFCAVLLCAGSESGFMFTLIWTLIHYSLVISGLQLLLP